MSSEVTWMICLIIMLGVAYYIGHCDGAKKTLSDEAALELEKYRIDKFFENEHWKIERGIKHGDENA